MECFGDGKPFNPTYYFPTFRVFSFKGTAPKRTYSTHRSRLVHG